MGLWNICYNYLAGYCAYLLQKIMIMKKNMGTIDKSLRLAAAAIIALLYFTNTISGTMGVVLLILSFVFVLTSFISFCPLYLPFGISTREKEVKR